MLAPVSGSSTKVSQPTTTSSPTTSASTASTSKATSPADRYISRSSGEEIPQTCLSRSSGEEIPQTCSVGGVSKFSLSAADFSAK